VRAISASWLYSCVIDTSPRPSLSVCSSTYPASFSTLSHPRNAFGVKDVNAECILNFFMVPPRDGGNPNGTGENRTGRGGSGFGYGNSAQRTGKDRNRPGGFRGELFMVIFIVVFLNGRMYSECISTLKDIDIF
jgi:hypothetical protein